MEMYNKVLISIEIGFSIEVSIGSDYYLYTHFESFRNILFL